MIIIGTPNGIKVSQEKAKAPKASTYPVGNAAVTAAGQFIPCWAEMAKPLCLFLTQSLDAGCTEEVKVSGEVALHS